MVDEALMITAMFATPRLPAVMATVWPGFTFLPRFSRLSSASTAAGISLHDCESNDWRTRKMRG